MNDEYTGIFDNLNPEDFNLEETTAISETPRGHHGADAFNAFVAEQQRAVVTAYMAGEGDVQPIALLANQDTQRIFTPDDEETVAEFIKRLNREAHSMGAVWTFYACKTQVAFEEVDADAEVSDADNAEDVQAALAEGRMTDGILWYAERREGDEQHRRQGVMPEVGHGRLGSSKEASSRQSIGILTLILS